MPTQKGCNLHQISSFWTAKYVKWTINLYIRLCYNYPLSHKHIINLYNSLSQKYPQNSNQNHFFITTTHHGHCTVAQPNHRLLRLLFPWHFWLLVLFHLQNVRFILRIRMETLLLLVSTRGTSQDQENHRVRTRRLLKCCVYDKN